MWWTVDYSKGGVKVRCSWNSSCLAGAIVGEEVVDEVVEEILEVTGCSAAEDCEESMD